MSNYDRAITVFSPDGQLLQVQYAQEAVRKGSAAVGVRGPSVIVLGVERRAVEKLQDGRTEKKIVALDEHVMLVFAGLRADARVLISRAQIECQSHRLTVEDPVTVEYISRYIAELKQRYTQSNGRRPFGISCLVAGFDEDGTPHLFQTEPSGIYYEWKAASIGRYDKSVRECLEQHYRTEVVSSDQGAVQLAIRALMEVQSRGRSLDIAVMKKDKPVIMLREEDINSIIKELEKEKESAETKKRK
ncbi:unnamed protein product [Chilo suppressalis]|uniref:Proteasome alpha-type subunits domain-containing protein n=1 Tax=Chilo suppressalis TaxID=168631 RepID=A0ABN8B6W8_CHISP|nr:unnamed protein product [Chilo suppressalis]